MTSQTTQSVIKTNYSCNQDPKFNGLMKLRSNPNTFDVIGRTNGDNIPFNKGLASSYDDFRMRRKAEILQYKNNLNTNSSGYEKTNKMKYTDIIRGIGSNSYSKNRLITINQMNDEYINCNKVIGNPPSNSGIWFNDKTPEISGGLYLDKNVNFYLRL
jgi:hypothetical protein